MSLKDEWKKVGEDFAILGVDLGKSIVKSVKIGASKLNDWAEGYDQAHDAQQPTQPNQDSKGRRGK